jgi:hypothetical protein
MVFLTAVLALSLSCQKVSEVEAVDDSFKKYGQEFKGKIAKSYKDSEEWWPDTPKPPAGTPNVIISTIFTPPRYARPPVQPLWPGATITALAWGRIR